MPTRRLRLAAAAALACASTGALVLLLSGGDSDSRAVASREAAGPARHSMASISPVGGGTERATFSEVAPAAAPEAALGVPEPANDPEEIGVIRGFVRPSGPVDLGEMRVVAVPLGWSFIAHMPLVDAIAAPEAHGLFLAECDVDGSFTLGPGLDPGVEYVVIAGGDGEATRGPFEERPTAGARVEIPTQPVVGLVIRVEDETGERLDWSEHVSVPVGLVPTGRGEWGPKQEVLPHPIARALLGVPGFRDSTDEFTACMFGGPGAREVEVRVHKGKFGPSESIDVLLQPVVHGLEVTTLVVEGAVPRGEPLTIHFPPAVAEALRKCDWPVQVWIQPGADRVARLEPGSDSWTTTAVPPGTYRVEVHAWLNQRFYPEVHGHGPITIGDEPVELWLPRSLTAAVAEFPFGASEMNPVAIKCPFRAHMPHHALYAHRGAEIAVPLIWDGAGPGPPEFELSRHPYGARVPLLDADGRAVITPAPRERIRLTHGRPEPVELPKLSR